MQADDDRNASGRGADGEGDVAKAEVDHLNQKAGDRDVQRGAAFGQVRLQDRDQRQQDQDGDQVAQRQQRERPGVQQTDLGDGKARRPQEQEQDRGDKDQRTRHGALSGGFLRQGPEPF